MAILEQSANVLNSDKTSLIRIQYQKNSDQTKQLPPMLIIYKVGIAHNIYSKSTGFSVIRELLRNGFVNRNIAKILYNRWNGFWVDYDRYRVIKKNDNQQVSKNT